MVTPTRIRYPGRRANDDVRTSVTLELDELPLPLTFYLLVVADDEAPDEPPAIVHVGFNVGAPLSRDDVDKDLDRLALDPASLRRLAENLFRYRRLAETALRANSSAFAQQRAAMRRAKGDRITDEYLQALVHDVASWDGGRGAIYDAALARGVSRVTIWRHLKEAERRGIVS